MLDSCLIVGLGMIGGSYAMGLTRQGCRVDAIDIDQPSITWALDHGIINRGATHGDDWIASASIIILGLYPTAMVEWVRAKRERFANGLIITDVSGVKAGIVETVQALLPEGVEFISCHPMAGREVGGVQNSDDGIFRKANFIITPTAKNTDKGLAFAYQLAEILAFNHVAQLSPLEHDRMIGFLSQLTHAIAVSLMNCNDNTHLKDYTGDSFRDLTRIARINEKLWSELFLLNRDVLIDEIDAFQAELSRLRGTLVNEDKQELTRLFIQSTQRRKVFDK